MGAILGLGVTHVPLLAGRDEDMARILRRVLEDPDLPAEYRVPDAWPPAMRREWGDDEGQSAARRHRESLVHWFRKARRLMRHAEKFGFPVVTFLDIPGADPGAASEERGQAMAIADCIQTLTELRVPIVATVIGEGGSGGALALGVGDRVFILEYGTYSVISPEGCAAILWKDQDQKAEAAAAQRMTAPDLKGLGVVDAILPEPLGGAHTDPAATCRKVGDTVAAALSELARLKPDDLVARRYQKFRALGAFDED